jgi:hypothetical protein
VVLALNEGHLEAAEAAIKRAEEIGTSSEGLAFMRENTERARATFAGAGDLVFPSNDRDRFAAYRSAGIAVAGGWVGGLLVLTLAGSILSALALRSARQPVMVSTGESAGLSRTVRSAYRFVLWASCAYYYISIPLLFLFVLGLGGVMVYGLLASGHIPLKLVLFIIGITFFHISGQF